MVWIPLADRYWRLSVTVSRIICNKYGWSRTREHENAIRNCMDPSRIPSGVDGFSCLEVSFKMKGLSACRFLLILLLTNDNSNSLPGAIAMFALSLGIGEVDDVLPGIVYALLSGLNASTVGIIALSAVQVWLKSLREAKKTSNPSHTLQLTYC